METVKRLFIEFVDFCVALEPHLLKLVLFVLLVYGLWRVVVVVMKSHP